MAGGSSLVVAVFLLVVCIHDVMSHDDVCTMTGRPFDAESYTETPIETHLEKWEGIVLIVAFGVFGIFVAILVRIIRTCIYYDCHLLDVFFDGGGSMNFLMVACTVIGRWLWTASYTWSTASVLKHGLVGHYWYAACSVVPILIFAVHAVEMRTKAPGAKTFLQVINARFGKVAHILIMIFALIVNGIIGAMILMESTRALTSLTGEMNKEAIAILLVLAVGVYTVVGGAGANAKMAWFMVSLVCGLMLTYFLGSFFHKERSPFKNGNLDLYKATCGLSALESNMEKSVQTFFSFSGMMQAIVYILCCFSSVFINQSFYSCAVMGKPNHSSWGYLMAGLFFFAIPLMLSYTFGMIYWAMAGAMGSHIVSEDQIKFGYVPVLMSQLMAGRTGSFMMYALTLAVTMTSVSGEILSVSSIIIYDIYQTYLAPFVLKVHDDGCCLKSDEEEAFVSYNKRANIIKIFIVAIVSLVFYPLTLLLLAIDIDLPWLFKFLGVFCGCCVMPVTLTFVSHRTTAVGVISGVISGFICAVVAWLIYASTFEGGLQMFRQNTGRDEVFIVGAAIALGVSLLVTLFISCGTGGCDPDRTVNGAWDKCRTVDNPLMPWAVHYAPECGVDQCVNGRPSLSTVREAFKSIKIAAYVLGPLLAVIFLFIWPAFMLLAKVFSWPTFNGWFYMVLIWACITTLMVVVFTFIISIIQLCCQQYSNRMFLKSQRPPPPVEMPSAHASIRPVVHTTKIINPAAHSCGIGTCYHNQVADPTAGNMSLAKRWQTFIKLD